MLIETEYPDVWAAELKDFWPIALLEASDGEVRLTTPDGSTTIWLPGTVVMAGRVKMTDTPGLGKAVKLFARCGRVRIRKEGRELIVAGAGKEGREAIFRGVAEYTGECDTPPPKDLGKEVDKVLASAARTAITVLPRSIKVRDGTGTEVTILGMVTA